MRVILTGATSFIGKAVMKELQAERCQVFAVVRPDSPGLEHLGRLAQPEATAGLAGPRQQPDSQTMAASGTGFLPPGLILTTLSSISSLLEEPSLAP